MSIRTSAPDFDRSPKLRIERFQTLDADHIKAIESLFDKYPFLKGRLEIHLPGHRAKTIFEKETLWVWPKFDRRPANFLIFIDGFAPCMWDATRQEGYTLRWILPPGFSTRGPVVFLANLLKGESVLQIEDLLILYGIDLWSTKKFSERWTSLKTIWSKIPTDQPLLAVKPRIVTPTTLDNWPSTYDASLSWIIQSDCYKSPRWFWWDSVTPVNHKPFEPPPLKRSAEIPMLLCALCKPYLKLSLPDTYVLYTQEGQQIGIASIRSIDISQSLRQIIKKESDGIPVQVEWNTEFNKYQIKSILPKDTPISVASFFPHATLGNGS